MDSTHHAATLGQAVEHATLLSPNAPFLFQPAARYSDNFDARCMKLIVSYVNPESGRLSIRSEGATLRSCDARLHNFSYIPVDIDTWEQPQQLVYGIQ